MSNSSLRAVGSSCQSLQLGYYVCVGVPGTPTNRPSSTPSPINGPSPQQSGIISTCKNCFLVRYASNYWRLTLSTGGNFYRVTTGDGCQDIVNKYGTFSLNEFYKWNPAVGTSCQSLQAGYYVCVGIPGTPTQRPAPTAAPTPKGPLPTQSGIIADCILPTFYRLRISEPSTNLARHQIPPSRKRRLVRLHRRRIRHFHPRAIPDLESCRRRRLRSFVPRLLLLHRNPGHSDSPCTCTSNAHAQGLVRPTTPAAWHEPKLPALLPGQGGRFMLRHRTEPESFSRRLQFLYCTPLPIFLTFLVLSPPPPPKPSTLQISILQAERFTDEKPLLIIGNPGVGNDCRGLFLGYYVCIGV